MPGAIARPRKGGGGGGAGGGPPEGDDAFIRGLNRFIAWAQENTGVLTAAVVVLVVAIGGVLYWQSYQQSLEERAAADLAGLQTRMARGGGAGAVTDSLQAFVDRFDGTEAGREARVLLARQQLRLGRAAAAVETIRPVAGDHAPDTPTGFAARTLLAEAEVAAGDTASAVSTLGVLAEDARFPFQRHEAAAERASLLAERGRLREARDIYRRLVEETAGDEDESAGLYAIRLGEIEARLASGDRQAAGPSGDTASDTATDTAAGG